MRRRTKIVATMGPAVADLDSVRGLIEAGMDVARLNFSHGDHDSHLQMTQWIRQAAGEAGRSIAILQDIQGPKTRVGTFEGGSIELKPGETVRLVVSEDKGRHGVIPIGYRHLLDDVEVGDRVVMFDGLITGRVVEAEDAALVINIERGGELHDRKGIAFPDSHLNLGPITEKDRRDLELGREMGVDYVAASFVKSGEDIAEVRRLAGGSVPIIAKVELALAYQNLDSILGQADGVMVARGDLGVQLPMETIPNVQADILHRTNQAGLISITATEMLDSMITALRPTRAEVTDVANAVASRTDAVMLSAETAVGRHPARVIEAMSVICLEAERFRDAELTGSETIDFLENARTFASATAKAATEAAFNLGFKTIVAFTESGATARILSKYRPSADIMVFAAEGRIRRRMALFWGVTPIRFKPRESTDRMFAAAEKYLEKEGICERGEGVVMIAGTPPNTGAYTNLVKLHVIGERLRNPKRSRRSDRSS
ncbi:MAG: pyruvate kinase [Acidimicrobiia bacterium]|nr:pyruvate kinase [Acidimicrobiia bacterium]MYD04176.1 pyruvate kinase [Acidimicrobiia bacterium]MYF26783.1 pyruvate kinase [Acidimicrobiia bacterium]